MLIGYLMPTEIIQIYKQHEALLIVMENAILRKYLTRSKLHQSFYLAPLVTPAFGFYSNSWSMPTPLHTIHFSLKMSSWTTALSNMFSVPAQEDSIPPKLRRR